MENIRQYKQSNQLSVFLIVLLLLIRIPFRLVVGYYYKPFPSWANLVIELGAYSLIALLIWIRRADLSSYNVDRTSILMFILSGTILRIDISLTVVMFWLVGCVTGICFIRGYFSFSSDKVEKKWFVLSCVLGIMIPISVTVASNLYDSINTPLFRSWPGLVNVGATFLYQLSRAVVPEEFLFRGFLWGFLKRAGWGERRILLFQAGLFCMAHLYYINKPFTFWVALPIMALLLGWIASRTRSITTSILLHTMYNTMGLFI